MGADRDECSRSLRDRPGSQSEQSLAVTQHRDRSEVAIIEQIGDGDGLHRQVACPAPVARVESADDAGSTGTQTPRSRAHRWWSRCGSAIHRPGPSARRSMRQRAAQNAHCAGPACSPASSRRLYACSHTADRVIVATNQVRHDRQPFEIVRGQHVDRTRPKSRRWVSLHAFPVNVSWAATTSSIGAVPPPHDCPRYAASRVNPQTSWRCCSARRWNGQFSSEPARS